LQVRACFFCVCGREREEGGSKGEAGRGQVCACEGMLVCVCVCEREDIVSIPEGERGRERRGLFMGIKPFFMRGPHLVRAGEAGRCLHASVRLDAVERMLVAAAPAVVERAWRGRQMGVCMEGRQMHLAVHSTTHPHSHACSCPLPPRPLNFPFHARTRTCPSALTLSTGTS
jgi:hypothetical protein